MLSKNLNTYIDQKIPHFNVFIDEERLVYKCDNVDILKRKFTVLHWSKLVNCCLIALQTFNDYCNNAVLTVIISGLLWFFPIIFLLYSDFSSVLKKRATDLMFAWMRDVPFFAYRNHQFQRSFIYYSLLAVLYVEVRSGVLWLAFLPRVWKIMGYTRYLMSVQPNWYLKCIR